MHTNYSRRLGSAVTALLLAGTGAAATASAAPSEHLVTTISDVSCVFETVDSDLVFFGATASSSTGGSGSFMFVESFDDGAAPQKAEGSIALRGGKGRATADLVDLATGEVVADLAIRVDLTRVGTRQIESEAFDGVSVRMARTAYTATIEVTTSDGRSGVAECPSLEYSETIILRPGSGPGGR